jgi:hypothetical protein
MIHRHFQHFFKLLAGVLLAGQAGVLSACTLNQVSDRNPVLHTTISADGQMIAALANAGTPRQMLCIRSLATDTQWRSVQAPPLTQTIRFASQGHQLLLTYYLPQAKLSVLARLDADKPDSPAQKLFEAESLAFPVEVSPGRVMVRTRKPSDPNSTVQRFYLSGYHWILVGPGQQVEKVGPDTVLPYGTPNIVGSGFFWTEEQMDEKKEPHPQVLSYPLPGGRAPEFPRERLEKNTWTVACDQTAKRCLRKHVTNRDQRPAVTYIYDVDVLFGSERCKLPGVAGAQDVVSVTPDGSAAVMSFASGHDKPRHVVVMRFKPQQCEPTAVQHFDFEAK